MDKKPNVIKRCSGGLDAYLWDHQQDVVCEQPVVAVVACIGPVCREHFNGSIIMEQSEDDYCQKCDCFKGGDVAGCNCDADGDDDL